MFIGRKFWKSSLLESEKSEISLLSSNAVTSLIDLNIAGAFSGRIGLPPAVMGWAASCDDGP